MASLSDLLFDLNGWKPEGHTASHAHWSNATGDMLSLHLFPLPPDLPGPLEDLPGLRNTYREAVRQLGGGLLEADTVRLAGLSAVRVLFKFWQQPTGMAYVASFILPFEEFSYVLKVQCPERGIAGLRDSTVFAQLLEQHRPSSPEQFQRWIEEQWAQDPYDYADRSPVRRTLADDPRYDAQFPDHPLSRLRRYLLHLEPTLRGSPALHQARPFTGPSPEQPGAPRLLPSPRRHHYDFAHRALPQLFLQEPDAFLSSLREGGRGFLSRLWRALSKELTLPEVLASDGLDVQFRFEDDAVLAVVRLPPTRAVAEAMMVGCHCWVSPALRRGEPARYFTLELGPQQDGTPRTVLGEWTQPGRHLNHGEGPSPSPEAFIAAIRAMVRRLK